MKIILHGKTKFRAKCPMCGCVFSYTLNDIRVRDEERIVHCPECGQKIEHIVSKKA